MPPAPGIKSVADIKSAIGNKRIAGPGANWHDPHFSVGLAQTLNVANYNQISLGFGGASSGDLVAVRNFLVHPNEYTRAIYLTRTTAMGFLGIEPDDLIASPTPGGASVLETWISDLHTAATNACT